MPTVLPMTRVEAYLAYKAGVIAESDLKPSLKTNFYSGLENWLAYWCGLTADYPKDENNDPKWYTEEEYYVAYLCGIAPDYPVNCYRRVGAYLRYIISARWDRPEKPLTREEYYLSLMDTSYLPPNDPASIITLDDTAEAPFKDLKIYGDTFQQTYTGKNLWGGKEKTYASLIGFTATYNIDGTLSVTGTASSRTWAVLTNLAYDDNLMIELPAGTYTFTVWGGKETQLISTALDGTGETASATVNSGVGSVKFTTSATRLFYPRIRIEAGATGYTVGFMIEQGSTATDYEPYTGSTPTQLQPSPNPDYPQDIQVVTGEQTVSVTGKNICSGTKISGGNHQVWFKLPKLTSGNIVLSTILNESLSGNTLALVIGEQSQGTLGSITATAGTRFSFSCSLSEQQIQAVNNTSDAWLRIYNSTANFTTPTDPMIEYGSTATTYEPYQSQRYEVNLGKNLWGGFVSSVPREGGDLSFVNNADGTISVSSGTTSVQHVSLLTSLAVSNNHYITLKAGSYVVSGGKANIGLQVLDTSGVLLGTSTFTLTTEKQVYVRAVVERGVTVAATTIKPQLELGTTATTYAPYFTPIELCKIGTYQDYIWKDGADWKVHKEVGKVVIDGSENWENWAAGSQTITMAKRVLNFPTGIVYLSNTDSPVGKLEDTHFQLYAQAGIYNSDIEGMATTTGNLYVRINKARLESVDSTGLKTWFSTHNTTVYYALATDTDTVITDASLISQLDALLEGGSYAPQTNITLTTAEPNLPGLLQVTAAKWQ